MSEASPLYYPLLLDLKGKKVLVVGGGEVARRKVETLLDHGAVIHLVSRELSERIERWVREERVRYLGRDFREEFLQGISLVIAATDNKELNHRVSETARTQGLLINAVDQPADCNVIVPSIVKRGDLLIAVSTSGKSPALAKKIRVELEGQFGEEYTRLLKVMGRIRGAVLARNLSQEENSLIFQKIVYSPILDALKTPDWEKVLSILKGVLPEDLSADALLEDEMKAEG